MTNDSTDRELGWWIAKALSLSEGAHARPDIDDELYKAMVDRAMERLRPRLCERRRPLALARMAQPRIEMPPLPPGEFEDAAMSRRQPGLDTHQSAQSMRRIRMAQEKRRAEASGERASCEDNRAGSPPLRGNARESPEEILTAGGGSARPSRGRIPPAPGRGMPLQGRGTKSGSSSLRLPSRMAATEGAARAGDHGRIGQDRVDRPVEDAHPTFR